MINASQINAVVINGSATAAEPPAGARGDAHLPLPQTVAGFTGASVLWLEQAVCGSGATALAIPQAVGYLRGASELELRQTVAGSGAALLSLAQCVYSPAALAGSWLDWDVRLWVEGRGVVDDLLGSVTITIERDAARAADFTVRLAGVVDVLSWIGKRVTIDYLQSEGACWRRFSGIIAEAVLDIAGAALACTCTDELQRIADLHSDAQLQDLLGGHWSAHVFSADNHGWERVQDLLSTISAAIALDDNRQLRRYPFAVAAAPAHTFNTDRLIDDSLSVELAPRSAIVNTVEIEFSARFERLYQHNQRLIWKFPLRICDALGKDYGFPTQDDVAKAVDGAGYQLLNALYTPLWPTANILCDSRWSVWINNTPSAVMKFDVQAAARWRQSVTHQYTLRVSSPASIAAYNGELAETLQASADLPAGIENWDDKEADFRDMPAGFASDDQGLLYRDEADQADIANALSVLQRQAEAKILASHRANIVAFETPLAPYLSLADTVVVDDVNVSAKGIVNKIVETYDFDTARAVSSVELSVSAGWSGLETVANNFSLPAPPVLASNPDGAILLVPTHIGGRVGAPAFDEETMWGWFTNERNQLIFAGNVPPGVTFYTPQLSLEFPAIADGKTQNLEHTILGDSAIDIPQHPLILTV